MPVKQIDADVEKHQLAPLRRRILDLETQHALELEAIRRLSARAFRNGPVAHRRILSLMAEGGPSKVLDVLDGKGLEVRAQIGMRRGSVFTPARARFAEEAITELKQAVGRLAAVGVNLRDHRHVYDALYDGATAPSSGTPIPLDGYPVWGGQPAEGEAQAWYHKPVAEGAATPSDAGERPWFNCTPVGSGEEPPEAAERATPGRWRWWR